MKPQVKCLEETCNLGYAIIQQIHSLEESELLHKKGRNLLVQPRRGWRGWMDFSPQVANIFDVSYLGLRLFSIFDAFSRGGGFAS